MSTRPKSGLLNREAIKAELEAGRIFKPGSWDEHSLRAAGYDVRLASDLMYVPDPMSERGARYYARGTHRRAEIVLQPGDTAFVSTVERLCLPWTISASVGPKFGLTAKGILMLTGFLIDPGYGLTEIAGEWLPKPDDRLHFFFANVGPQPVVLSPEREALATLQFSWIAETQVKRETASTGFSLIDDAFLRGQDAPQGALLFFKSLADIKSSMSETERTVDLLNTRIAGLEAGSNQILLFGVFLVSATFLGVVFVTVVELMKDAELLEKVAAISAIVERSWPGLITIGLAIIGIAVLGTKLGRGLIKLGRRLGWLPAKRN